MQLKTLFYIASSLTFVFTADVNDVLADLQTIQTEATTLNTTINAFPTLGLITSLGTALDIHSTAIAAITMLDKTTADVQTVPMPVSDADATRILNAIQGMAAVVEAALQATVAKKNSFLAFLAAIPGASNINPVKQDLMKLNTSVITLGNAFIARAPASVLAQAKATQTQINSAFSTALAAFGS